MRVGQKVRIIADRPSKGQDSIAELIGKVCEIAIVHRESGRETGEVSVWVWVDLLNDDQIVLQFGEYELMPE